MGEKWKKPPVFYTVAQLSFNQVLSMEKYVPEIQDRLRLRGFPVFRKEKGLHCFVDVKSRSLEPTETFRWSFSDNKGTQAYVLFTDALAYHTTSYEDFGQFSRLVLEGLQDVHEVVKLDCVLRIGLRYLDAVVPTETRSLEDYLVPELHDAFSQLGRKLKHRFQETVRDVEQGVLISKLFVVENGLPLPPDLHPLPLSLPKHLNRALGKTATLDNDCSSSRKIDLSAGLDRGLVLERLQALKGVVDEAFKLATTELAREEWR